MNVKIKDIPRALVEKLDITDICCCDEDGGCGCRIDDYNEAITLQGEVQIGINREMLIHCIKVDFESTEFNAKTIPESIADAILSDLKGLLEVKK